MENLNEALGAVCQKCGNTGQADSGGVQSWGEPISIPCDCTVEQEEFLAWACQEYGVEDSEELNENHRDIRENKKGWMARAASLKRSKFHQHLDKCADDVATWPSYKREVLTQPCSTKAEQAGGDERASKPGLFCRDCGCRLMVRGVCSIYCPNCVKAQAKQEEQELKLLRYSKMTTPGYYWWLPEYLSDHPEKVENWTIISWHPANSTHAKAGFFYGPLNPPVTSTFPKES